METRPPDMLQAGYVDMLVTKLSNKECRRAQKDAARQLARLSLFDGNKRVIANSPKALDALVGLLFADHVREKVQKLIVEALGNLAKSKEYSDLLAARGVVDGLVPLIEENCSAELTRQAAKTLKNLAMWPGFKRAIDEVQGTALIINLVQLLGRNVSSHIHVLALKVVLNLASAPQNQVILVAIRDHAFTKLAQLIMISNDRPAVSQELATGILMSLALSVRNMDIHDQHWSIAIESLIHLLGKHVPPRAQKLGIMALRNLAASDKQARLVVGRFPGLRFGLLRLLDSPAEAILILTAQTIRNLTREAENVFSIALFPRMLEKVLLLLNGTPAMQEASAGALVNLSKTARAKILIVLITGAMQGVTQLMSNDGNRRLQFLAAETMGNLTESSEAINLILAKHPGALQTIEGLLRNHLQPDAQHQAARSIANISALCKVEILNQMLPRILPNLVELLYKYEAPYPSTHILRVFEYMARSSFSLIQLSGHPDALAGIGRLTSCEFSQDVQEQAKKALASFQIGKFTLIVEPPLL